MTERSSEDENVDNPAPIDAEFEPVGGTDGAQARPGPHRHALTMAGFAAAAAVIGGLIGIVFDPNPDLTETETQLSALSARISTLEAQAATPALPTLNESISSLQSELARLSASVEALESGARATQSDAANAALADLRAQAQSNAQRAADAFAEIRVMTSELNSVGARIAAIEERVAAFSASSLRLLETAGVVDPAEVPEDAAAEALIGSAVLVRAAGGEAAFTAALNAARASIPDDDSLTPIWDRLTPLAARGAPTPARLAARFSRLQPRIIRTAGASGGSVLERLARGLTGVITVAHDGADSSNAVTDVIARTARQLRDGDVGVALAELETLEAFTELATGPQADSDLVAWVQDAGARRDIDAAVAQVQAHVRALPRAPEASAFDEPPPATP